MKGQTLSFSALLFSTLLFAGCASAGAVNVPNLALSDVKGKPHFLSDFIGRKVVVMSFWATSCVPCRQELAVLQKIYKKEKGRLLVLAVSVDGPESQAKVRAYVRQQRLTFPVLLDSETRAAVLYNPRKQLPLLHIFDRTGRITYTHTTFVPGDARELRSKILIELEK